MNAQAPITYKIDVKSQHYPIVYVRGYAATIGEREETFFDAYYGYAASSVEKRDAAPPTFLEPIVFEGQLIRLIKEYGYVDAANGGLALALSCASGMQQNPTRSIWISRFYDRDVVAGKVRQIEEHAEELRKLICETIPTQLKSLSGVAVDLGQDDLDYKVILIAHSMGGLVCRCLIQNLLASNDEDAKKWIHRLVTIGTPHRGIELSAVPEFLEDLVAGKGNILGSAIFKEERMRKYLKLGKNTELNSLNGTFPEGRCLSIIGSDYESYSAVKKATGSHSDGLVRQDNAYIKGSYYANVHRAHSGRRGIVNSFESYENIRRFLFGDTRVKIWLENVSLKILPPQNNITEFYDIEFSLSVRGTGVYLHQRKQNPCENAQRFERAQFPLRDIHLHTGFLDTKLRSPLEKFSHFLLAFRVSQHRVKEGFVFDSQYPERTIYSESIEVRINLAALENEPRVQFRWLSDAIDLDDGSCWETPGLEEGVFRFPFRQADTLEAEVRIRASDWPDDSVERTGVEAHLS